MRMSVLSVHCPTCLSPEGERCVDMFAPMAYARPPHPSRIALYDYGPDVLSVFTGDISADPDERIKPLGSIPEAYAPPVPAPIVPAIPYTPTLPPTDAGMPDGTILRWDREWPDGGTYPYAAIKTEVGWWLTGKSAEPMNWHSLVVHHLHFAERVERAHHWIVIKEV